MNDPSVAVSPADTAQTSGERGRTEDLVQEIIMRFRIWTARWQPTGPRRALLFTGFAWLIIAVIALRFTLASVTADVLAFLAAAAVGFLAHDVAGRTEQGARAAGATGVAQADPGPSAKPQAPREGWIVMHVTGSSRPECTMASFAYADTASDSYGRRCPRKAGLPCQQADPAAESADVAIGGHRATANQTKEQK